MKISNLKTLINDTIIQFLNENKNDNLNFHKKYLNDLKNELSNFKSDEELLRNGGLSIELLDRLAHGFSEDDIKKLNPSQLNVRWKDDLENVKWEISKSKLTPKEWASKVDLSEPIDVSYWQDSDHKKGFYIEDGHHRYVAAQILKKPLNVNLEIKVNPIKEISPNMGYDEFHRYVFNTYKSDSLVKESELNNTITVYHGTKPKFVNDIKNNGLIDKSGYNQGWYMVSTDFESALFHAHPDDNNSSVFVIEFEIPNNENDRWDGYPYLWKGQKRNDNSTWFALMQQIPKEFIKKIHKVDYDKWTNQKNLGF